MAREEGQGGKTVVLAEAAFIIVPIFETKVHNLAIEFLAEIEKNNQWLVWGKTFICPFIEAFSKSLITVCVCGGGVLVVLNS